MTADLEIAAILDHQGQIAVSDFMARANAAYYAAGDPLGRTGDFITAPEISQIFGELIGLWCAAQAPAVGGAPDRPLQLIELGPGRGTLMADLCRAYDRADLPPPDIHLVETSPALRARQEAALAEIGRTVSHHEDLDSVPDGPGFVIANEFLDALPVRQAIRTAYGWAERVVVRTNSGLAFAAGPDIAPEDLRPGHLAARPGDIVETRPAADRLAAQIAGRLGRSPGAALMIDYGYTASAPGDTLQAVRRHAYTDPLADPGRADLTAHVDFEAVSSALADAGATVFGPISQRAFLLGMGAELRRARLVQSATPRKAAAIVAGLDRLIAPEKMGTLFQAISAVSPHLPTPPAFAIDRAAPPIHGAGA